MFYFLSTSETNWIFKKNKPDKKNKKNKAVLLFCALLQCVTGENGGCALSGAQTIKHVETCCKSCHSSQYLKVNSISAAIDPSEVMVFKLTGRPHSLPGEEGLLQIRAAGGFQFIQFMSLHTSCKWKRTSCSNVKTSVSATGSTQSISTVHTSHAGKHHWTILPITQTKTYVKTP